MAEEVNIYVEEPGGAGVQNVYLGLHDSSSKALLQTDTTDASGVATFSNVDPLLNSGIYEIRVVPSFPSTVTKGKVQNITVLDAPVAPLINNFDVEITKETLDTATNTRLCRCSGYFVDQTGKALSDVSLNFTEETTPKLEYQSESTFGTKAVIPTRINLKTDSTGKMTVDLYRNATYEVHMEGFLNISRVIKVPDLAAVNLPDILFPIVGTVEWYNAGVKISPTAAPTLALSMAAGAVTLTYKVLLLSGMVTTDTVTFTSDDTAVVTIAGGVLTPVSIGTASITIARVTNLEDGDIISPVPDVIGTLTVTVGA